MFNLLLFVFESANIQNKNNPAKIIFQPLSTSSSPSPLCHLSVSSPSVLRLFYGCSTVYTGKQSVNYRETIGADTE
jgi:hypothetical protein